MIVELCGLPGSGKSTLAAAVSEKAGNVKDRRELLRPYRYLRHLSKVKKLSETYCLLSKNEKELLGFAREYESCDGRYACLLLHLYRAIKLHKKGAAYLLEEGPLQYLTSIAYDSALVETEALKRAVSIMTQHEKAVIVCECPVDVIIDRIAGREKRGDRYNIDDKDKLTELLRIKKENIDFLIKRFDGSVYYLDMTEPIAGNADRVLDILRQEGIIL